MLGRSIMVRPTALVTRPLHDVTYTVADPGDRSGMKRLTASAAALLTFAAACAPKSDKPADSGKSASTPTSSGADLTGAGATFPQPIYTKWVAEFMSKTGL